MVKIDKGFKAFAIILLWGLVGVFISIIEYLLVTNGVMLDEYITTTTTLQEVMIFTIAIFQLIGVFHAGASQ